TMTDSIPPLPHPYPPGTARAALAYPSYRLIWTGLFLSSIGTWMQNLALPAYIDDRTGSAKIVGLLVFAQLGPLLLLAIPGAIIADKVNRRTFLLWMQWVQLVFSLVLAFVVSIHGPIWALFLAQIAIGIGNALNAPAFQATVPLLVDRRDLAGAISMNSVQLNGSRVLGPTLAALLSLGGVTTPQLFIINAATYLFLILALSRVALPNIRGTHPETGWRRALTGLRISRERRVLARLLVTMASFSFFSLVYVALFSSVARLNFGISPVGPTYRWLYAIWGFGALCGALATGTFLAQSHRPKVIRRGFFGFAISLAAFAIVRHPAPAFPIGFFLGAFYFMSANAMVTVFQQNLKDTERVSVMPLWFMAFGGTVTLGGLAGGPIIDAIGARWVLLFGALFALFLSRFANLDRLPKAAFLTQ
ncbi:MAG: MFS transporter, partial [Actinomycetota bacterium]